MSAALGAARSRGAATASKAAAADATGRTGAPAPPVARRRARVRAVAFACAVAVLVAGCGSGPATVNPAQAKSAIERSYATLFDFTNHSVTQKMAVIQDGSTLRKALTDALSSSLAKNAAGAKVSAVHVLTASGCQSAALPSPCAKVTYSLLSPSHTPLFATASTGYAVYVSGRWLVAKSTICGLLELFYSASGHSGTPPGC